jgi:hypothetical protein
MLAALAKWGITPKFHRPDWRTYNRNAAQGWGPLYGFVVHCFGSDGGDSGSLDYLRTGDPLPPPQGRGLPGPLSQFAITDDGQVWLIAWGTANHMGSIDPRLHALVLKDAAPMSSDFRPNVNFGSPGAMHNVNDNYLGVEMTYGKAPTAAQRKSVALLGAALMDALGTGYTAGSVIGHREATTDRSDPTGIPMWQLRREIDALLKAGPAGTPSPVAPQEADMQFNDIVPGSKFTVGQALLRAGWAYDQLIDGGSIDSRIDGLKADLTRVGTALAADDKAKAQAILDQIQISLSVKPEPPAPAA